MEPAPMAPPPAGHGLIWEARLVHAEPGRRIVEAAAWRQGQCLGRSLGEADGAEAAEERAIARLQRRLAAAEPGQTGTDVTARAAAPTTAERPAAGLIRHNPAAPIATATAASAAPPAPRPAPEQEPKPEAQAMAPPPNGQQPPEPQRHDPDDWSEELAEIDVQLQRLGWDRSLEGVYLQRAFAHPSRSRLTSYADLAAYLRCLRNLQPGASPEHAAVPLRRRDLLEQSDLLLANLGWDAQRGRGLLEEQFQCASRQQLSDEQLLHFNMLLEEEVLTAAQLASSS